MKAEIRVVSLVVAGILGMGENPTTLKPLE
jgi:hypothetical protein